MVVFRVEHNGGRVRYVTAAAYESDPVIYSRVIFYEDAEKTTPKAFFNGVENVEKWGRAPETVPVVREDDPSVEPAEEVLPEAGFMPGACVCETKVSSGSGAGSSDEVPF
jgi:hypothetical protein